MLLKIARMGAEVLARPSKPVIDATAPEIRQLAHDMIRTCESVGGAGLAAPQVYHPLRMFVYRIREQRIPEGATLQPRPWTVVVNPEITPQSDEKSVCIERCLSLPGLCGPVPRYRHVICRGIDLDGKPLEIEGKAIEAYILQHEYDHLDGILYVSRMKDVSELAFVEERYGTPRYDIPVRIEDYMV